MIPENDPQKIPLDKSLFLCKDKKDKEVLSEENHVAGLTRGKIIGILKIIKEFQRQLQKSLK